MRILVAAPARSFRSDPAPTLPSRAKAGNMLFPLYSLLTTHCSLPIPSHQTTKFPPTPSIRSTSASHVRIMKLQYYTLTVIHTSATIPRDSPSPHILAFLLLTVHHSLPTSFRCAREATSATPFRSCAYFTILWIPRGRGSPPFLRDLCALCVKINPFLHLPRSVWHPEPPARVRFRINAYQSVRNACIQRTCARLKPFKCNVYKKPGGGSRLQEKLLLRPFAVRCELLSHSCEGSAVGFPVPVISCHRAGTGLRPRIRSCARGGRFLPCLAAQTRRLPDRIALGKR
jgi:hypothetical protein